MVTPFSVVDNKKTTALLKEDAVAILQVILIVSLLAYSIYPLRPQAGELSNQRKSGPYYSKAFTKKQ
jgi:hypothetical protein